MNNAFSQERESNVRKVNHNYKKKGKESEKSFDSDFFLRF